MMSKRLRENKVLNTIVRLLLIMYFLFSLFCTYMFINNKALNDFIGKDIYKEDLGVELVNAMYNFESPYELDAQMLIVKQITTDSVFNDLTIDNEQRTLTTYLKFKDCSSKVHIIDSTDRYIRYWLESDVIEADREFVLFFNVDNHGLIDEVEEAECVKFLNTIY